MAGNPHDALFRFTFSQPANAASLIRSKLPTAVAERIDWRSLERRPGSFVDPDLSWRHSDLVFSARLAQREALIYLLVEHQRRADPMMAFRILRYVVRLWSDIVRREPKRSRLPAVLPLVVYHGAPRWRTPTRLMDLIDLDPATNDAVAHFLPQLNLQIDDLSHQTDEELRRRAFTDTALLTAWSLKRLPHSPSPLREFLRMTEVIRAVLAAPHGSDALTAVMTYFMEVTDVEPEAVRQAIAPRLGTQAAEEIMTTAERLRQEGRIVGKIEGQARIVLKQLRMKFGALAADVETRVQNGGSGDLDRWAERILRSASLDEVFGDKLD